MNKKSVRRNFIKQASLGLGSLAAAPFLAAGAEISSSHIKEDEKKLNIVCVGAHPGDPEFGCGGTMAKFAMAGHQVTFIYLTRGEAGDPQKSFAESAALRTREAEVACKIIHAKPVFAGQTDGNTELNKIKNEEMTKLIFVREPGPRFHPMANGFPSRPPGYRYVNPHRLDQIRQEIPTLFLRSEYRQRDHAFYADRLR